MARNGSRNTPPRTSLDARNMLLPHAIFGGNGALWPCIGTYVRDLFRGQFGRMVILAMTNAALVSRVMCIFLLRSIAKMPWIDTGRVVALMQKNASVWNRLSEQFVSMAMRKNRLVVYSQHPIPKRSFCPSPYPAGIGLVDSRHKCFGCADLGIVIKPPGISGAVVAVLAQLARIGRLAAFDTRRFSKLIAHAVTPFTNNNTITYSKEYSNV